MLEKKKENCHLLTHDMRIYVGSKSQGISKIFPEIVNGFSKDTGYTVNAKINTISIDYK